MATVRSKSTRWPAWTDEHVWQLGPAPEDAGTYDPPSDDDRRWAAENLNRDDEGEMPDALLDVLAAEHLAAVRHELGIKD